MKYLLALLLLLLPVAAMADAPAHFYVPPGQFNASLQVMKLGLSNITALFSNATGGFSYDAGSKTLSGLRLAVDATSIVSTSSDNQNGLSNLLGTNQYPEIRFTALDNVTLTDGKGSVKGTLTVHGTSKPVTLDATVNSATKTAHSETWASGGEPLGLSLHGSFKRADFGMNDDPDTAAIYGDTITLQLEMQAIKQ